MLIRGLNSSMQFRVTQALPKFGRGNEDPAEIARRQEIIATLTPAELDRLLNEELPEFQMTAGTTGGVTPGDFDALVRSAKQARS